MERTPASDAFSANVRAEMARRRRTTTELAGALGLSRRAVDNRLSGRSPWTVDDVSVVSRWLGVSTETLLMDVAS